MTPIAFIYASLQIGHNGRNGTLYMFSFLLAEREDGPDGYEEVRRAVFLSVHAAARMCSLLYVQILRFEFDPSHC